jgi:hypothetical protein
VNIVVRFGVRAVVAALVFFGSAVPGTASAASAPAPSPAQQLADKYAPVLELKTQAAPCDMHGEAFRPTTVDPVLGRSDVTLRHGDKTSTTAPTAPDLARADAQSYLDFPGNPLKPGCDYEKWFDEIARDVPTTVYGRVATDPDYPGQLALQYWFYWVFNDFNDKHESDWELIQLNFDADNASEALTRDPAEVGYAQHTGAESSNWDGDKLRHDGDHAVVYVARGSHAAYYSSALWLGHGSSEGFGCDDTRGPSTRIPAGVVMLPTTAPTDPNAEDAWLAFPGRWGQKEHGPNNGPDGPAGKDKWKHVIGWTHEKWHNDSVSVPAGGSLGVSTTSFFCDAVAAGSNLYLAVLRNPLVVGGIIGVVVLAVIGLFRRTKWSPALPDPVDQRRHGGEMARAAFRIYRRDPLTFLAIGLSFIPLGIASDAIVSALRSWTRIGALIDVANDKIIDLVITLTIGSTGIAIASTLVAAATATTVDAVGRKENISARDAYRSAWMHVRALLRVLIRIAIPAALMAVTIVGIPFAILWLVRASVAVQAVVIEDLPGVEAVRRSRRLVRHRTLRVFGIAATVNVFALVSGALIGIACLFLTTASLRVLDTLSSVIYTVVMPFAAITIALLFYDLRQRESAAP